MPKNNSEQKEKPLAGILLKREGGADKNLDYYRTPKGDQL